MATHFEGIEKRVEIQFILSDTTQSLNTLLPLDTIKTDILVPIRCAVLDVIENAHVKAILLSESSMFIFKDRIMIKTCGRTTLLHGVQPLIDLVNEETDGATVEYMLYSRRSYNFPGEQVTPHRSWKEEVAMLEKMFPDGTSATFGDSDKFHVFLADRRLEDSRNKINFLEVAMRRLDTEVMQKFFLKDFVSHEKSMNDSGLTELMHPDCEHNGFMFTPCGFSSNSILDKVYYTIHITPEEACSYVSFETNYLKEKREDICDNVEDYFNPGEMSFTCIADSDLLENFSYDIINLTPDVAIAFHKAVATQLG